jgi:hypothetical protein
MVLPGENEAFGGKPVAIPFRPPQIPYVKPGIEPGHFPHNTPLISGVFPMILFCGET